MNLTYQGESFERNERCLTVKKIYTGTRDELEKYLDSLDIGSDQSEELYAVSAVLTQHDGPVWKLEITYLNNSPEGSFSSRKPDTSYGKRTARLECSCISVPIETLPSYRKHWDHYLICGDSASADGIINSAGCTVPDFWETADASFLMPRQYLRYFRWIKDTSECPHYVGNDRLKWRILCNPTKPGMMYVDRAVYKITESIRCRTSSDAGKFAADVINKITLPNERFGIKGAKNCWKCDSASIYWDGRDWIASIVYTMSPDPAGWDQDLYGSTAGSSEN